MNVIIQGVIATTTTSIRKQQWLPDLQPLSHTLFLADTNGQKKANQHHNTMLELTPARNWAARHCNHIQHNTRRQKPEPNCDWITIWKANTRKRQRLGQWGEQRGGAFPSPTPQLAAQEKPGIAQYKAPQPSSLKKLASSPSSSLKNRGWGGSFIARGWVTLA